MSRRDISEQPGPAGIVHRSAHVAGTAVSVHAYEKNGEGDRLDGCGPCAEACAYVAKLPWGGQACLRSREKAAVAAFKRNKPVPFLCHMGFSCVTVPLRVEDCDDRAITFGPFCPAEVPGSLDRDALEGLSKLSVTPVSELPFELDDIPLANPDVVLDVAQWTVESLLDQESDLDTQDIAIETGPLEAETKQTRGRQRPAGAFRDPYQAADILTALGGGDRDRARAVVRLVLSEREATRKQTSRIRRARAVAMTSATIEAAERADWDTARGRAGLSALMHDLDGLEDSVSIVRACMRVLRMLKPASKKTDGAVECLARLDAYMSTRDGLDVTLSDAAHALGEQPSTLTKRLQRLYGMSFSEYVGRRRVDRAKELLVNSRLSITEIALRVGVTDVSNFSKLFRKYEGMSSSEYRKRAKSAG